MADGVEWYFQLIDHVSSVAQRIAAVVKVVGESFEKTEQHVHKSESTFGRLKAKIKELSEPFFFLRENVEWASEKIEEPFEKLKELMETGFEASDFRRNTLLGLDAMLSTGYEANDVLEKLEGWAKQTGLAKDTFTTFGKNLLGAGFREGELKPLLAALSDVQALNGGKVSATEELFELLKKIRANDKVNERELAGFAGLGIKPDSIYAALAAQRHTTLAQAKALFGSEGAVGGYEALDAILTAISTRADKGGPLGQLGETWASGSVPAQIQKVKDAFGSLFEGVNSPALAGALGRVAQAFSPDAPMGKAVAGFVGETSGRLANWIASIKPEDISHAFERVASAVRGVTAAFHFVTGAVGAVVGVFRWLASGSEAAKATLAFLAGAGIAVLGFALYALVPPLIAATVSAFSAAVAFLAVSWPILAVIVGVGLLALGIYELVHHWKDIIAWLGRVGTAIGDFVAGAWHALVDGVKGIGTAMVDGIWNGIKAGWAWMLDKFHDLVELLPASVKKILGIASPSKVFMGLGLHVAQGFGAGIEAGDMPGQMERSLAAPEIADAGRAGLGRASFGGAAGGGGNVFQAEFNLHVEGGKDPQGTADATEQAMRRVFLPELAAAFDQFATEAGG